MRTSREVLDYKKRLEEIFSRTEAPADAVIKGRLIAINWMLGGKDELTDGKEAYANYEQENRKGGTSEGAEAYESGDSQANKR